MIPAEQFRDAIRAARLAPPDTIEPDGQIHRLSTNGKRSDDSGWYVFHDGRIPAGAFGDWRSDVSGAWRADIGRELTDQEKDEARRSTAKARAQAEVERKARHTQAAKRAAKIWDEARPAPDDHVYLTAKGVKAHGLRVYDGKLVVPMRDTGSNLHSLQLISGNGERRFLTGGRVAGCYYGIGKPDGVLCIAEGYATGASIHEATGHAVAIAFSAGNLLPVAKALREKFPNMRLVLCADDDALTSGNPGITKATEAARAIGGLVAVPDFGESRTDATDFNDLAQYRGAEAVKCAIENAQPPEIPEGQPGAGNATADDPVGDDAEIKRLAGLPLLEYERERVAAAKRLGTRAAILDKAVASARPKTDSEAGESVMFPEAEPWPEPVDGAQLLDELTASARRYIVLPSHGGIALALWVLFTYLIDAVNVAPIMALASPEKRCGKTTVLAWLSRLIYRMLPASNITPAALFRAVEAWKPTLLIDEADSFLRENEELRGVLNSGHTRATAYVIRTVGEDFEPRRFCTWGAKAVALIGRLPDTLHDRSIVLDMRRKLPSERVEKLRYANEQELETLARKCLRFATDNADTVRKARPGLPDTLNDRAADNWEPLLAIAEAAGGDWPERARTAALALSGAEQEAPSLNIELLADIQGIFARLDVDRISGAELVAELCADRERPWATFTRGKELTQAKLARRLSGFGITSKTIRLPDGKTPRGYQIEQFSGAFARYLPKPAFQSATTPQANNDAGFGPILKCNTESLLHFEKPLKPNAGAGCGGVALSKGGNSDCGDGERICYTGNTADGAL